MYHVVVCDHMAADGFSTRNRHDWRRDTRVCLSSGAAQALCLLAAGLAAPRTPGGAAAPEPASALSHPTSPHTRPCLHQERRHKHPFAVSSRPSPAPVNTSPSTHISRSIRLSVSPSSHAQRCPLPPILRANSRYEITCRSLPPA